MLNGLADSQLDEVLEIVVNEKRRREKGGLTATELALLKNGHVIDCIKAVRQRMGLPLREAKDIVDKARLSKKARCQP